MKLSQTKKEDLSGLTPEQMATIVYGERYSEDTTADAALILGSSQRNATVRARGAVKMYREGRFPYVIPSGGVAWEFDGISMTEAEFMQKLLLTGGVPEEAILLENEATTTKENFIYGTLQLNRRLRLPNVRSVGVITSAFHMRRSMGLAKLLLPRSVTPIAMPVEIIEDPVSYVQTEYGSYWTRRELPLLWELIEQGLIDDIVY